MAFNTAGARQAGYSDLEIAEFLGKENKFNTAAAIEAGYSPEEVIQYLVPRESTIGSELVRGAKQLGSSLQTGIGALFGSPEAAAQAGIERGQVIGEAAGEGPSFERARQAYETGGIGGAAKEVAGQIPRAIAGQLPQMAALATGARLGATAGAARGPVGAVVGGAMGAGATLLPSFFGSDVERQAAEQLKAGKPVSIDRGSAALAATGQVALEGAGTAFTLGKRVVKGVLGIADDVALQTAASRAALEATAKRSLLATTAQGVARGLAVEIPVEIAQQVLERAQAGLDILSPDAFSEYGETAYQTGLAGGPFGAAGRIYERSGAHGELAKEQADIQEAGAAERRARQAAQREAAAQQISGIKGEKILDAEAAEQAKVAKAEEAAAQQTMKEDYAQRRAEREAELKEAFPADYSDVMERANRYGVLATELASLTGVRKTPEVKGRIRTLQARMADVAAEDDRIPNEFLRMQRDQVAATRAAGFPAKKSAAVLGGAFPAQMEMREALAPGELPPQTDLFGAPLLPTTPQPEGLATVAEAELPLTSEVLRDAGIAPTTKELEAAGQQRLPLRKTPAGQPTSPLRPATPVATEVVAPLPEVAIESAAPAQPGAITPSEIKQFGTMSKANRDWLTANIEGRTPEQVRDMVDADPTIIPSVPKGLQTVLKEIVATAAPKETPSVQPTPAPVLEAEPQLRARRGKPSMAVPSEPARAEPVGAPAPEPTRAEELAPPVGLGLAPAGQPVGERAAPKVAGEPALDPEEAQRQAEAKAVIDALANVRKAAQTVKAKAPAPAPAPAPTPVKAAPKEEAPAPAPTGSPFDVLERIKARKAAEALAEKPAKAKTKAAPKKTLEQQIADDEAQIADEDARAVAEIRAGFASEAVAEAVAEGQSIGSLRGEILRAKGASGSALRRAIASGKVVLETRHPDGGIGGYFDGKKVTLYAEGIPAGQAMAVALHEVGAHMGFKSLFGDRVYSNIIKQIQELATSKVDSTDRTLAKAAMNRIPESDKARGVDVYGDETLAYFIEEAVKAQNAGTLATSGPVRTLFNNIRLAMLAAINRVFGSKLGVADLTTRDILSMAEGAFIRESFSRVRKTAEAGKGRASTTAKAQPITDIITDMDREMPVEDTRPLLTRAADALREGIPKKIEGVSMIQRVANMAADQLDAGEPLMREIRKEVRASLPPTEANEVLVALSYSQASHDGGVATAALDDGGITYNDELAKFTTEKSGFNRNAVHDVYKRMAKEYGMTMPQARYATSTALESKRMLALYDTQADMLANAEVLKAAGSTAAATKMREKAEGYIFHMTRAQVEKGMELFKAAPEISEIEQIKEGMRGWIRKHLQDTGVWSEETGQWMLDNAEWIPFNREAVEAAEGDVEAGGFNAYVRGLQVKAKEKAFKGSMREVHDVMDNFESWSDYSVRRGILNKKASDLATAALEYLPESEVVAVKTPMRNAADRTVSYLVNGEPQYVEFASAAKAQIFKGAPVMARSALPVIGGLVDSLNSVFRGAILNFPLFPIYQLAMDSISAVYLSGLSPKYAYKIPVLAVKEALATLRNASVAHERLRSVGATGVHDYNASLATVNDDVTSRMKSLSGFEKYVALMHKMNLVADNAVRQGVYLAARDSGLSEAAAVEKAFEIINFRTRVGNNKLAAAARNVVFLNSFYAASRAALKVLSNEGISPTEREQAKKTLLSNLAWLGGISFVLALSNIGDDDYEKMSRQEQAGKLTLPGMHGWGIPLRPDVFMLVKVMAEMIARQSVSEFADDPAKVKATISDALSTALLSGPVPVAQPIKVAVELAANHSFFTGRPLVGRGLETQEAFRQFSTGTSELAKGIGVSAKNLVELTGMKSEGISPVKIDHVIQGMLGMYGGALVLATNSMVNGRPTQSMQDTIASLPGMGRIGVKEFDSQIKSDFYDLAQTVHKAVDTANRYKAQGMREEYQEYAAEKKNVIKYGGAVQQIERQLSNLRNSITSVAANKSLTPEARDARILELRNTEKRMLKNLEPLIKKMRTEALS